MEFEYLVFECLNIGIKVLLDEESNIIVDDEETKREERRSKMLQRRTTLVMNMSEPESDYFDNDDLSDSTSSKEAMEIVRALNILSRKNFINFIL